MQLNYYNTNFNKRTFPITLICEHVTNAPNIGSLFRAADAFGVENIIFCGDHIPLGRKMTKTSRSTEKAIKHQVKSDVSQVVLEYQNNGYQIIALEITSESKSLDSYSFSLNKPIALVIGSENFGISEFVLNQSDAVIHIDMFGQNSSMNVVQATSIALFEITKQLK